VSAIADRLAELGLMLPPPMVAPPGVVLPFSPVIVRGHRAVVSGHGPQEPNGSLARPLGKVGADVSAEQGYEAARLTALGILGSLERALGDLDRITAWTRVFGMAELPFSIPVEIECEVEIR
jgi:enamine deaminase RidA (YjgF/YER057c/UK114 family)